MLQKGSLDLLMEILWATARLETNSKTKKQQSMKSLFTAGAMVAILLGGANAFADSISPSTFDVDDGAATSAQVDVYFLADTTASMGAKIGAVQASASALLSSLSGLGNVAFGVGEYKDDPATSGDPSAFRMNSNISTDLAVAQAGINLWGASRWRRRSGGRPLRFDISHGRRQLANWLTENRRLVWERPGTRLKSRSDSRQRRSCSERAERTTV